MGRYRNREQAGGSNRRRSLGIAVIGTLLLSVLMVVSAYANHLTTAGDPELHNLEHVFNFDPGVLDGDTDLFPNGVTAGGTKGSDVEFFTHSVPLRDYSTGQLVDETGAPVTEPVYAERDFAVVGSYDRGGVIFDITDPEFPEFVNVAVCQQPRNDVGVRTFVDEFGNERVVLALTQQTGTPCPNWEVGGGLTVDINNGPNAGDSYPAVQWGDTAAVTGQTADLVYGGTGCTAAQMAAAAPPGAFIGKIAIVTMRENPYNPADQCPTFSFFQKVNAAEANGAIGLIQVDEDDIPRTGVTAVTSTIPGVEINNSAGIPIVDQIVTGGLTINATLNPGTHTIPTFGNPAGTGGIGVFDITDPYRPGEMYRIMTTEDGVHNFAFHPTAPFGYVSPGELPGGIQDMPIFDFTNLDAPTVVEGLAAPQTPGGIHDVELSITGDFIYAASENNYHIYDNSDPGNPTQVGLIGALPQNPPTVPTSGSYAHGLFPDTDQEIMIGQVESIVAGGFLAPGTCPGEGLATYDISGLYVPGASKALPAGPISVYNPPVVGDPAPRFCTSHFGRFVPQTRIFTLGWYIAGVRVVDFSDPFNPVEIATAVMADGDGTSNTWAAKVHEGPYIYAGDMERGFDVFKWNGPGDAPWDVEKNQPPTAVDDQAEVDAGMSVNVDVRANDFDPNDERGDLTVSIESGPSSGNAIVEADGTVTYTHNGDGATTDSFEYRVTDPAGDSDVATVTISINQDGAGGDGDKVTGGGYLLPDSGKKINFGFNAKVKGDGTRHGHLALNDKSAGVKVRLDTVTALGAVQEPCGDVAAGPDSREFTGTGSYNGVAASFRVCVADLGEPGNSGSGGADMFYLECTLGCGYATGDRTPDDVIDGGNIQLHAADNSEAGSTAEPGSEAGAAGADATVLVLDPMLLTQSNLAVEVLTLTAYNANGELAGGVGVTLRSVAPDGTTDTIEGVTDATGIAVFTVTVLDGDTEHLASSGALTSNAVDITGGL